ncbi:MAG: DUF3422 domain-containing protein [Burkholderiaceae bacterium]|nr:DUF3422 domain-containing protein [Burkholderiaceae bacterium]
MLTPHPQRVALHNEVHARPYEQMTAPAMLTHLALLTTTGAAAREHLQALLSAHGLPAPAAGANHLSIDLDGLHLRWEAHTEFQTYTFWHLLDEPATTFEAGPLRAPPADWLASMPGEWIVGLRMLVTHSDAGDGEALARKLLDENSLVGAGLGDGQAHVYTDFRLHPDGHTRQLLCVGQMNPRRLGRTVQRLLEVETYRMMALLGLPVAREVAATLADAERDLAQVAAEIRSAARDEEPALLRQLTQLAGRVESLYARTHARFSASSAYFELVQWRLDELREVRHAGLQTLAEFLDRRLAPAMQTCVWAARRQQALSERISRTSNLLRTRVEIEQQRSSQALLDAMNRRQKAQLLLQSAVEGLSVAAVTYYGAGLVGYLAKGAKAAGFGVSPEILAALSIPLIALAVWWGIHRLHARVGLDLD